MKGLDQKEFARGFWEAFGYVGILLVAVVVFTVIGVLLGLMVELVERTW